MIVKKFHINVPLFITNPYVVRLDHNTATGSFNIDILEFRKILKIAKTCTTNTWGYSSPEIEHVTIPEESRPVQIIPPSAQQYTLNFSTEQMIYRSYWVFKDEMDALQFRLTVGETARHVYMWPTNVKFTIQEYTEVSE
jgi:hypothetical protein